MPLAAMHMAMAAQGMQVTMGVQCGCQSGGLGGLPAVWAAIAGLCSSHSVRPLAHARLLPSTTCSHVEAPYLDVRGAHLIAHARHILIITCSHVEAPYLASVHTLTRVRCRGCGQASGSPVRGAWHSEGGCPRLLASSVGFTPHQL